MDFGLGSVEFYVAIACCACALVLSLALWKSLARPIQYHHVPITSKAMLETSSGIWSASDGVVPAWEDIDSNSDTVSGLRDVGEVATGGVGSFKNRPLPTFALQGTSPPLPKLMPVPAAAFQRNMSHPKTISMIEELVSKRAECDEVVLFGNYEALQHGIRLTKVMEGVFSTQIQLPVGQHEVKFLVDGEWALSHSLPKVQTLEGNFVNILNIV